MSVARELLDAAVAAGARFEICGNRLRVTAPHPLPDELVSDLRRAKPEILRLIPRRLSGECARWGDRYAKQIAHWSLRGQRAWQEAERLAFGELILEWHRQHGARPDPGRCSGCGDDLPAEAAALTLGDGARLHFDSVRGADCIIAYGTRWRGTAVAGLQALGIEPPEGFELL